MLSELNIKNFAIIDDLTIFFHEGLNILSGETGAGKSIIINALNLILGGRPSASLIRNGATEAEIQAMFHVPENSRPLEIIKSYDLPLDDGIIIRRIISSAGRNRIYINGKLAPVQVLTEISEHLASISGQHAHQLLMKEEEHIDILDSFGNLSVDLDIYKKAYEELLPMVEELQALRKKSGTRNEQLELLMFQKEEIENASLSLGEDEKLSIERTRLKNSVILQQTAYECLNGLYSGQSSAYSILMDIRRLLERNQKADEGLKSFMDKADEIIFRIEDFSSDIQAYMGRLEANPERLEEIDSRLDLLTKIKRKYGGCIESAIKHLETITYELENIGDIDLKISMIEKELSDKFKIAAEYADALSCKRKKAAEDLDESIEKELASLNMKGTLFKTLIAENMSSPLPSDIIAGYSIRLSSSGKDRVVFMIAPNKGEDLKPLSMTASGGELSRVVLAIKSAMASDGQVETIVFDEVDTGIGGATAEAVGEKIKAISKGRQVVCITHLAQIAKFGHHHFSIEKQVAEGRTRTSIKKLSVIERIEEIGRMIGGMSLTDATLNHARELLVEAGMEYPD